VACGGDRRPDGESAGPSIKSTIPFINQQCPSRSAAPAAAGATNARMQPLQMVAAPTEAEKKAGFTVNDVKIGVSRSIDRLGVFFCWVGHGSSFVRLADHRHSRPVPFLHIRSTRRSRRTRSSSCPTSSSRCAHILCFPLLKKGRACISHIHAHSRHVVTHSGADGHLGRHDGRGAAHRARPQQVSPPVCLEPAPHLACLPACLLAWLVAC